MPLQFEEKITLTRRNVLKSLTVGSLAIAFNVADRTTATASGLISPKGDLLFAPDGFVRIGTDNRVTLIMSQVEMGQGIYTAVAMMIAEELDLDLDAVVLQAAPFDEKLYANPIFGIQATGGSTSVRGYWMPMRTAGASARSMLLTAASRMWGVPRLQLRTELGRIIHDVSGRSAKYGDFVEIAAGLPLPSDVSLKDPATFRLIGRAHKRLDTSGKVNGSLVYGIDAMPPGLSFATVMSSPVPGGILKRVDDAEALHIAGVEQVVTFDDMVAVIAKDSWAALKGLNALVVEWDDGPLGNLTTADLRSALNGMDESEAAVAKDDGGVLEALQSGTTLAVRYDLPILAHAPMEPVNCTAWVTQDRCEVWVGSQVLSKAVPVAAEAAGLPQDKVILHNHLLGGGFGRKLEVDFIYNAVRVAKVVGRPVKVFWRREEDIGNAVYRSLYGIWMQARLEDGLPTAWRHRVVGPAVTARWLPPAFQNGIDPDAVDCATETPYDLPKMRVEYTRHEPAGLRTAYWRGVGPNLNVFAVESFLDRLAREVSENPLEFRRKLLPEGSRARAVLDLAAEKAKWDEPLPKGEGKGIALLYAFGSYLCAVAHVAVSSSGAINVKHVVCAVDCGVPINPDGVVAQMQGGLIFGLTAALFGEITIDKGRVQQSNFHDYRMLRFDEAPQIDVHIVKSGEAPGGLGEPGTTIMSPALANAVYAATNVPITSLPIKPEFLRGAMS